LAISLAVVSLLTFGSGRITSQQYIPDGGDTIIMSGVVILAVGGAMLAGYKKDGLSTGALIALASPIGMAVYLILIIWIEGPSSDSPTWLIYLMYTAFFVFLSGIGYTTGLGARRILSS
jgi:peptidoglycan/LPS O-acetylase OafA/YrhL